jgi:aspartyl-tRNA(Asn)/glutamyl-tRNA(Gln) amidotransferase subunit B
MEEGSLRVDANVSTRPRGETKLGTKTEVKNMNSFSGVVRAVEVEFARQCALLEQGGKVEQQTMLWDANAGEVRPTRSKEGSHDYRYFPDPDLPPLVVPLERIDRVKRELPELPEARRARFKKEYSSLTDYDVDVLTASRAMSEYFEAVAHRSGDPKTAATWIMGELFATLKATGQTIEHFTVRPADLADLLDLVADGTVSRSAAKQIFLTMVKTGDPPAKIAERDGLLKVSDDASLARWIDEVLADNPDEARRFLGGEMRLQGVLVGRAMKKSNGAADPKRLNQLLAARLGS